MKKFGINLIRLILGIIVIAIIAPFNAHCAKDMASASKNSIYPMAVGNTWKYQTQDKNPYIITIKSKESVFADRDMEDKDSIFTFEYNGEINITVASVKESSIVFSKINKAENGQKFLTYIMTFPLIPTKGWTDKSESVDINERYIWKDIVSVTVPAGTFNCWYWERHYKDDNIIYRSYYAVGVGMVKQEKVDKNNKVIESKELTSFELK